MQVAVWAGTAKSNRERQRGSIELSKEFVQAGEDGRSEEMKRRKETEMQMQMQNDEAQDTEAMARRPEDSFLDLVSVGELLHALWQLGGPCESATSLPPLR